MTAEINELFEEAITRARELTDAADGAMDAVDDVAKEAEDLAQRVQDEATAVCQQMRELAGRLERAESELESARGQAEGALERLTAEASGLEGAAGDLLERVKKALDELQSRKGELEGSLDTSMTSTQHEFEELARRTQDTGSVAEQQFQEAVQAVAALRTALDSARAAFADQQSRWNAAIQDLETSVRTRADEWVDAVEELLRRQSVALVEAANAMVDHHNAAMDGLKARIVQRAPKELETALGVLEAALTQIGEDAADHGEQLSSEAGERRQWAANALPVLNPVRAALEAAAELE